MLTYQNIHLVCDCGDPLAISYSPDWDGKPKWVLGHMKCKDGKMRPLIHGSDADAVLLLFIEKVTQVLSC